MKRLFPIILILISGTCFGQQANEDSLHRPAEQLNREIVNLENELDELSQKSDSIFNALTQNRSNQSQTLNLEKWRTEREDFQNRFQVYFDSLTIPLILPFLEVDYKSIVGYGERIHPYFKTTHFHNGLDFPARIGVEIQSSLTGTVKSSDFKFSGKGISLIIGNDTGVEIVYAHLDSIYVRAGEQIKPGQVLGTVGISGQSSQSHLHLELRINNDPINPIFLFMDHFSDDDLRFILNEENQTYD
ncbi:MAG: M23 family metallopeptidase [Cyclobacteriaceae bacterium]